MNRILKLVALVSVVFITGCASTQKISMSDKGKINQICLVSVAAPEEPTADDFGNFGSMLGVVGAVAVVSSTYNATESLAGSVSEKKYNFSETLADNIHSSLSAVGYEVRKAEIERPSPIELLEDYENIDVQGSDAILDIAVVSYGYKTEHPLLSPHWRPSAKVSVSLIEATTHKVLYQETLNYGYHNPFISGTDLNSRTENHFDNQKELFEDKKELVDGLNAMAEDIGTYIANELKK